MSVRRLSDRIRPRASLGFTTTTRSSAHETLGSLRPLSRLLAGRDRRHLPHARDPGGPVVRRELDRLEPRPGFRERSAGWYCATLPYSTEVPRQGGQIHLAGDARLPARRKKLPGKNESRARKKFRAADDRQRGRESLRAATGF